MGYNAKVRHFYVISCESPTQYLHRCLNIHLVQLDDFHPVQLGQLLPQNWLRTLRAPSVSLGRVQHGLCVSLAGLAALSAVEVSCGFQGALSRSHWQRDLPLDVWIGDLCCDRRGGTESYKTLACRISFIKMQKVSDFRIPFDKCPTRIETTVHKVEHEFLR